MTKPIIHVSLFSGIGGFDLAAEWAGFINALSCEINPFGRRLLEYYWPGAYHHDNIYTLDENTINLQLSARFGPDWRQYPIILTGGFPCQGFSLAGKRLGTDDDRYLWPEMRRVIRLLNPTWVIGENVTGILSMEDKSGIWSEVSPVVENRKIVRYDTADHYEAIYTRQAKMLVSTICENLEEDQFEVQPIVVSSGAIGLPHKRERIWLIAHANSIPRRGQWNQPNSHSESAWNQLEGRSSTAPTHPHPNHGQTGDSFREQPRTTPLGQSCKSATNTNGSGLQERKPTSFTNKSEHSSRPHVKDWADWPTQPAICFGNDEFSRKLDGIALSKWRNESIKGAGNAVSPAVVYQFFNAINHVEATKEPNQ